MSAWNPISSSDTECMRVAVSVDIWAFCDHSGSCYSKVRSVAFISYFAAYIGQATQKNSLCKSTHFSTSEHLYWIPFHTGAFLLNGLNSLNTQQYFWLWTWTEIYLFPFSFPIKNSTSTTGVTNSTSFYRARQLCQQQRWYFLAPIPTATNPPEGGASPGCRGNNVSVSCLSPLCWDYNTDCSCLCGLCPCPLKTRSSF